MSWPALAVTPLAPGLVVRRVRLIDQAFTINVPLELAAATDGTAFVLLACTFNAAVSDVFGLIGQSGGSEQMYFRGGPVIQLPPSPFGWARAAASNAFVISLGIASSTIDGTFLLAEVPS